MKTIAIIALIALMVVIAGCGSNEAPQTAGTDQGITMMEQQVTQIEQIGTANGITTIVQESAPQK